MKVSNAAKLCLEYHKSHSKENTVRAYRMALTQLCEEFGTENLEDITTERALSFLNRTTEGRKRQTKRTRYSHLLAFFNFIKNHIDPEFRNPCDTPMLKKLFRAKPSYNWNIIEKETVDEVIFRTSKPRNRLMLELMARGGMRISEVLKLTPSDINERRLTLIEPKSGREHEFIFIPQRLADRLKDYIRDKGIQSHQRIFPICYEASREMVAKAGSVVGIHLRPHDLRRHAATYASRSGVPIEIVSKVILRHSNLSTTERYLGKVSDVEAMKWIDTLYAFVWESMTTNNCNSYLIDGPIRVLIDPGHSRLFGHVELGFKQLGLAISDIGLVICTHAHPDHIEAVQLFRDSPALFTLHEDEWNWAATIGKQMSAAFGIDLDSIKPDFFLKEGNLRLDELELNIFHTHGHSPGSATLYWPAQKALFTGDLIFKEGFGRTDLPGGDSATLKDSIRRLTDLDVEWLLSGHGEVIAGAEAVRKNFEDIEQFYFRYI